MALWAAAATVLFVLLSSTLLICWVCARGLLNELAEPAAVTIDGVTVTSS